MGTLSHTQLGFNPTVKQLKLLELYLSPNCPESHGEQAKKVGATYNTIRKWFRNTIFTDWFYATVAAGMSNRMPHVWDAIYRTAMNGNVAAQKLFLERFDPNYIPQMKAEFTMKDNAEVVIDVQDAELRELAGKVYEELGRSLSQEALPEHINKDTLPEHENTEEVQEDAQEGKREHTVCN